LTTAQTDPHTSNQAKFRSKNLLVRRAIRRFFDTVSAMVAALQPRTVLDAGCGEGEDIIRLRAILPDRIEGFDIDERCVETASQRLPEIRFRVDDICRSSYESGRFDLVLALEVLEHLKEPDVALRELARLTRGGIIVSVPNEPWFRISNLVGGAFVSSWGNPPGHCQHWNRKTFLEFLARHVDVVDLRSSFPWIIARCTPRSGTPAGQGTPLRL
jgi:2-polyprenyl-3-methyl-5-hydroxy-6-metoxy-1,4-benzoquinol methylase